MKNINKYLQMLEDANPGIKVNDIIITHQKIKFCIKHIENTSAAYVDIPINSQKLELNYAQLAELFKKIVDKINNKAPSGCSQISVQANYKKFH